MLLYGPPGTGKSYLAKVCVRKARSAAHPAPLYALWLTSEPWSA
jgi:replication-associated recombination protein RarA